MSASARIGGSSSGGATPPCVMCESNHVIKIRSFSKCDLVAAYERRHGIDVSGCLTTDFLDLFCCEACDVRFFSPPSTGDVAFYRALSKLKGYYMEEKAEFCIARKMIVPGNRVLEIGGGQGGFAGQLEGVDYVGLEFNDEAVESARARGVRILNEPLEQHVLNNRAGYDVVCAFQVLEHIALPRQMLQNALACLKPGGRLILSVPSHDSFLKAAPNLVLNMPPHHVTLWSDRALLGLGGTFGCKVEDLVHEPIAPYHLPWFMATTLLSFTDKQYRTAPVLDLGAGMRLKYFLASVVGYVFSIVLRPIVARMDADFAVRGHAVVIALRK